MVDFWTSRQRRSVAGIKAQYIHHNRVVQSVCGFKEIRGRHTAAKIREVLERHLFEVLKIPRRKVFAVFLFAKAFPQSNMGVDV